ncbi:hypothetical protein J7J13_00870 [bacterium]|nr:hypothetical protein [bacterium]
MNTNLEPVEESDLDLKEKFGGAGSSPSPEKEAEKIKKTEAAPLKIEKETVGEINPAEKDSAYGKILSKVKKQPVKQAGSDDEIQTDAETASQKTDAESQIRHLTDLALNKGVVYAVKVAKHLEDNYTLDMFHDKLLADEFHKALVEKGLI